MNLRSSILCCVALGSALLAAGCGRDSEREAAMAAWRVEPGHKGTVTAVAFSPDGARIYSLGIDSTVRVWQAASGKQLQVFQVQHELPWAMALSPDGSTLAIGSFDKTIKVLDAGTGKELHTLTGHIREISGLAFSPDGRRLVSTDQHGVVRLWDTSTWELLHRWGHPPFSKPEDFIAQSDPMFTSDGRWIVLGGAKQSVWVFETATARVVHHVTVSLPPDVPLRLGVNTLALTHDNRRIVAADMTGQMIFWDTGTWKQSVVTLTGMPRRNPWFWPSVIATSPDDRLLALAVGGNAYLVDLASGKRLLTLSGHTSGVRAMAFSQDGKWLATGAGDDVVMLWDVATGRAIRMFGSRPPPRELTDD